MASYSNHNIASLLNTLLIIINSQTDKTYLFIAPKRKYKTFK